MPAKLLSFIVAAVFLAATDPANAQQSAKVAKIGELRFRAGSALRTSGELFKRELRELGYIEGKNIVFEIRSAEGKLDRFPALADELVSLKVDILVASSASEALAFKNATKTIPIVFISPGDPIVAGLVDSLARPGGNITGFTTIARVLTGKQLELLKETIPKLSRVAVLWNTESSTQPWKESQLPARELGLQLHSMQVSRSDLYESGFKEAIKAGSAALVVTQSALAASNQKQIVELAAKNRLPAVYQRRDFVESGGLMSYSADRAEPYRRAAWMVDKILKGVKPAEIPVEQPTKFELVINLKTAKQIGLTIPPNVLVRADKVIK